MIKKAPHKLTVILILSLLGGILFYAINRELLIFFCYSRKSAAHTLQQQGVIAGKKKVSLIFWQNNNWAHEKVDLVWPTEPARALLYLLNSWLNLLDEEQLIDQKITVQSVALTSNNTRALVSFDRSPLVKESSTYTKWLLLEGLLKTIHENNISINDIVFLVRHQPMRDHHLDFTNPWPTSGFFNQQ